MDVRRGLPKIIGHLTSPQLLESTLFLWLWTQRGRRAGTWHLTSLLKVYMLICLHTLTSLYMYKSRASWHTEHIQTVQEVHLTKDLMKFPDPSLHTRGPVIPHCRRPDPRRADLLKAIMTHRTAGEQHGYAIALLSLLNKFPNGKAMPALLSSVFF